MSPRPIKRKTRATQGCSGLKLLKMVYGQGHYFLTATVIAGRVTIGRQWLAALRGRNINHSYIFRYDNHLGNQGPGGNAKVAQCLSNGGRHIGDCVSFRVILKAAPNGFPFHFPTRAVRGFVLSRTNAMRLSASHGVGMEKRKGSHGRLPDIP